MATSRLLVRAVLERRAMLERLYAGGSGIIWAESSKSCILCQRERLS
jgi:hypothetical protein